MSKSALPLYDICCRSHIPNAHFFDGWQCVNGSDLNPLYVPKDCFEDYVKSLGISADTHIVLYDNLGKSIPAFQNWAAFRTLWLFRVRTCIIIIIGPRREKICLRGFVNNTGADQPAHLRSLISAFVVRFLESNICKLTTSEISTFSLVSVAEEIDLKFALSETPKTGFVAAGPNYNTRFLILIAFAQKLLLHAHAAVFQQW